MGTSLLMGTSMINSNVNNAEADIKQQTTASQLIRRMQLPIAGVSSHKLCSILLESTCETRTLHTPVQQTHNHPMPYILTRYRTAPYCPPITGSLHIVGQITA